MSHALLSPSSSHRWLNCPRSVKLGEGIEDTPSEFATEGTEAHELCEYRLKQALGLEAVNPVESLTYYSNEMEDVASDYVSFVLELIQETKPVILIEQRIDYSRFVVDGYGTADLILISDDTLHIVDIKYGRGIKVSSDDNPQLKIYALGALELFDVLYDIDKVSMTIYQPRIGNVCTSTMLKNDLYEWAENVLAPTAKLAYEGKGEFKSGSWCQFCKLRATCRERMEENMKLAQYEFSPLLSDDEVEEVLGKIDDLVSWASDIKEYALTQALNGKIWSSWKLVEGKSNRKFSNEVSVAQAVINAGYEPYEKKLLGITDMQRTLGKKQFDELLGQYIIKPQGKLTLVPLSDKKRGN